MGDWSPRFEVDLKGLWRVWGVLWFCRDLPGVARRSQIDAIKLSTFDARTPDIGVDAIRSRLASANINPVSTCVLELAATRGQVPIDDRCEDLHTRVKGFDRGVEPDLVVSLPGRPVCNGIGAGFMGDINETLSDERA